MKILVVYYHTFFNDRKTIEEHLYSFERYSNAECFYLNAFLFIPSLIQKLEFDLVVYHYTFLSLKWEGADYFNKLLARCENLKGVKGFKIALPQDEYVNSVLLCKFLKNFKIDKLYTCYYEQDWKTVYPPELTNVREIETVLTGYVDEKSLSVYKDNLKPHSERRIDIGYRARKVPYWLGEHGTIKWRLTEMFEAASERHPDIRMDVSNSEKAVFKGNSWHEFLASCRIVLGCEGGASLLDPDGNIRHEVDNYISLNPAATFEEVKDLFFKLKDFNIELFAISPRHFDACITKTCQVLVEGKYHGIFKPGIHYIELKKDFSNLEEVFTQIKDIDLCEKIAEQAYRDIIESGKYTYALFVKKVIEDASKRHHSKAAFSILDMLVKLEYFIFSRINYLRLFSFYATRRVGFLILKKTNLLSHFKKTRIGHKLLTWSRT